MKKWYKGIFIYVQTPLYRIFEFDMNKHNGLFKYCKFSNSKFSKNMWYAKKNLK